MGSEPPAEDWEQVLAADLRPHLVPAGRPTAPRQPLDLALLPAGAHQAMAVRIGRHGLEDLLILPGTARVHGGLRRHCLYTPLRVLGAGDRAAALWVQALPVPGLRAVLPFGEIAAMTLRADGTNRQLLIVGPAGQLPVRYDASGDVVMGALIRRLRRRAAGDPGPEPAGYRVSRGGPSVFDPDTWRLDPDDEIVAVSRYRRAGFRTCVLVITPREFIIIRISWPARLSGRVTESIYVPRRAIEEASIDPDILWLRSAGLDLPIKVRAGRTAASASAWLGQLLGDHDHSGADS